jgi:hypothetical protein
MPDEKKIEQKWASLCADFERGRDEHLVALGLLSAGIASGAEGQPAVPTQASLNAERHAWTKLKGTRKALREFAKKRKRSISRP